MAHTLPPAGQVAEVYDPPRNPAEVVQRLQKRLSALALAMDAVTRDVDRLQELVQRVATDRPVSSREVAEMALRLHDAREVLG